MLRKKLFISYTILLIFVLSVVSMTISYTISNIIDSQMRETAQTSFNEGERMLENALDAWTSAVLEISVDEQLQAHLLAYRAVPGTEYATGGQLLYNDTLRLGRMLSGGTLSIFPVLPDGTVMRMDSFGATPLENASQTPWYSHYRSRQNDVQISYFHGQKSGVQITKNVISTHDWHTIVAVARVEVSLDNLNVLLNQIQLSENGKLFLVSEQEVFLPFYASNKPLSLVCDLAKPPPYVDKYNNMVFTTRLGSSNMYLAGHVSMAELLSKGKNVQQVLLVTGVLAILAAMGMAWFFSSRITKPVLHLAQVMKNIHLGDLDVRVDTHGVNGEVRVLGDSFNYMMNMINSLVDEVYVSKLNAKQAELMALQAQINPHFLYNTLDSINWMAMKYEATDIQAMVSSLATMLRRTLNNGKNLILVRHEIEQLSSYIAIQKCRFSDLFEAIFMIDPSILDCTVIKLILQPLVENAIIHGFDEDLPERGRLFINGYRDADTLVFDIMNNGNLIDLDKIYATIHAEQSQSKSYGIKNVNDRLVQQYGSRYALQYFIEGDYTVARIVIPYNANEVEVLK